MSYFEFPHTRTYDSDLGWLITEYKRIAAEVDDLMNWMQTHKEEYQAALARLTHVENEINTFEARVNAEFAQLKADIEADFEEQKQAMEDALADTQAEIEQEMRLLEEEINRQLATFENRFIQLQTNITNEIEQLKAEVRREVLNFYNVIEANNTYVFQYVEDRLNEFINSFPEIITVYVYNPYRGRVTDIQTAIYDLYEVASIWSLTAQQYDSLNLTAAEYDALELTAREYDTMGYKLLYKDPNYYMLSPFTGELTHITEIIETLAMFHMDGLTANEYDTKDLTADAYDTLDITAYNYDWFGKQLIA